MYPLAVLSHVQSCFTNSTYNNTSSVNTNIRGAKPSVRPPRRRPLVSYLNMYFFYMSYGNCGHHHPMHPFGIAMRYAFH